MENSFGEWVKRRRKAMDLTQHELAARVGCSISLIFKIESDERRPSRQITELLAEHLEIPPDQRSLFTKIARQELGIQNLDTVSLPSLPGPDSTPNLLQTAVPHPVTALIGREYELRAIVRQLQDPACRLLTLLGPGGVGKTRLSLEVAHQVQSDFEHGAHFISLAGTSASEYIIPIIAENLGFAFSGISELKAQLFNFLRGKQLLLVLDNLEHLLNGIELLDELLAQAPRVKILTTSREALNLRAEWAFEVQGLPVPTDIDLKDLESNSAAALFIRRGRQAKTNFNPSSDDVQAIATICRLVEGLPLGLELAATWVRVMSVKEIVQEIERSVDFLTTTARDMPQRHRSIRAVFDYSWSLLSADEQRILRHLAVFSGGFTREAAELVAGADLSQLLALVDKSLLRHTIAQASWYDFHELIRQYVELKARENPQEFAELHERHASYYAAWLHKQEGQLQGPQQQETLGRISLDIDNVRSAWNWMVAHQHAAYIQQSLDCVFVLHDIRNWIHQGAALFEQAVTVWRSIEKVEDENDLNSILLGELMACQGHLVWHLGYAQKARDLLHQSLELLGHHRNRPMLAEALLYLSLLEHSQGNYQAARQYAEECVSVNRQIGRDYGTGYALSNLGMVCLTEGQHDSAYNFLKESDAVMRSIAHPRGTAINLNRLGLAALRLGKLDEAQKFLEEGLKTTRGLHDRWGTGNALNYLGWLALELGNLELAESLMRESVQLAEEDGDQILLTWSLTDLGFILREKNGEADVRQIFLHALQVAVQSQNIPAALYAVVGIATIDAATGKEERALQWSAYTQAHPSSNYQTKSRAEKLRGDLERRLSLQQIESVYSSTPSTNLDSVLQELIGL